MDSFVVCLLLSAGDLVQVLPKQEFCHGDTSTTQDKIRMFDGFSWIGLCACTLENILVLLNVSGS